MRPFAVLSICGALALVVPPVGLQAAEGEPEFTEEFMSSPENIDLGETLFKQQCARCHGRSAYPGKGPTLRPGRMDAEEVYAKITYGFGKMPAWEDVFSDQERMAITAYVMSDDFSN